MREKQIKQIQEIIERLKTDKKFSVRERNIRIKQWKETLVKLQKDDI